MWVKICANTTAADALEAARLGADAVGFVFAPSKRQVTAAQVRVIAEQLPAGLERVGVFHALPAEEIAAAAKEARLTAVQLHGGYDPAVSSRLRDLLGEIEIIETVHWVVGEDGASAVDIRARLVAIAAASPDARVLIDSKLGAASGGTGKSFDWGRAQAVLRDVLHAQPGLRLIVAGGLRPENVAEAVRVLAPWGVDVASGVEREPGVKDYARLASFIENARQA